MIKNKKNFIIMTMVVIISNLSVLLHVYAFEEDDWWACCCDDGQNNKLTIQDKFNLLFNDEMVGCEVFCKGESDNFTGKTCREFNCTYFTPPGWTCAASIASHNCPPLYGSAWCIYIKFENGKLIYSETEIVCYEENVLEK